jgi:hypothetical protein
LSCFTVVSHSVLHQSCATRAAAISVEQTAADAGATLAVHSIPTGSAGTGSDHLTGRAGSKQQQRKDRADRESESHDFVSFTPVNRQEGYLFHSVQFFVRF